MEKKTIEIRLHLKTMLLSSSLKLIQTSMIIAFDVIIQQIFKIGENKILLGFLAHNVHRQSFYTM
jgi:hypothetical protein